MVLVARLISRRRHEASGQAIKEEICQTAAGGSIIINTGPNSQSKLPLEDNNNNNPSWSGAAGNMQMQKCKNA